jgi:hypothetical protein
VIDEGFSTIKNRLKKESSQRREKFDVSGQRLHGSGWKTRRLPRNWQICRSRSANLVVPVSVFARSYSLLLFMFEMITQLLLHKQTERLMNP